MRKTTTTAKPSTRTTATKSTVARRTTTRTKVDAEAPVAHVLASVPDVAVLEAYVSRKIGNKTDFEVFDYARANRHNVLIEGPTGPGKTMFTKAWAAKNKRMLARVPSNVGIEPSQLFGKYVPGERVGEFRWVDGPVTHVVRHGGVLLINEVNFVPERVATVLFGLLDANREITLLDHEGEVIKAHDDLLIVADMNPDYEGTRPLNKAFRNRFAIQLQWDYDPTVERTLVKSPSLLKMAGDIRVAAAKGEYETPVSTNMLMEFESIAKGLGYEFAASNFVGHFAQDERPQVKVVLDTYKTNILNEVVKPPKQEDDTAEEEEEAWTEEDERRMNMADGEVDPEWGVKGVDWVWEDENQ